MVNVLIYLNNQKDAMQLVELLLHEKLIAKATIDKDNRSFEMIDGNVEMKAYNVVTIQTKSMLFSHISKIVAKEFSPETPIYSLPITQSNSWFDEFVRKQTIKI
jgi:uncharacterized protein involved in tolerance to divalent cations